MPAVSPVPHRFLTAQATAGHILMRSYPLGKIVTRTDSVSSSYQIKGQDGSSATGGPHHAHSYSNPVRRALRSFVCVSAVSDLFSATKVLPARHDIDDSRSWNGDSIGFDASEYRLRRTDLLWRKCGRCFAEYAGLLRGISQLRNLLAPLPGLWRKFRQPLRTSHLRRCLGTVRLCASRTQKHRGCWTQPGKRRGSPPGKFAARRAPCPGHTLRQPGRCRSAQLSLSPCAVVVEG